MTGRPRPDRGVSAPVAFLAALALVAGTALGGPSATALADDRPTPSASAVPADRTASPGEAGAVRSADAEASASATPASDREASAEPTPKASPEAPSASAGSSTTGSAVPSPSGTGGESASAAGTQPSGEEATEHAEPSASSSADGDAAGVPATRNAPMVGSGEASDEPVVFPDAAQDGIEIVHTGHWDSFWGGNGSPVYLVRVPSVDYTLQLRVNVASPRLMWQDASELTDFTEFSGVETQQIDDSSWQLSGIDLDASKWRPESDSGFLKSIDTADFDWTRIPRWFPLQIRDADNTVRMTIFAFPAGVEGETGNHKYHISYENGTAEAAGFTIDAWGVEDGADIPGWSQSNYHYTISNYKAVSAYHPLSLVQINGKDYPLRGGGTSTDLKGDIPGLFSAGNARLYDGDTISLQLANVFSTRDIDVIFFFADVSPPLWQASAVSATDSAGTVASPRFLYNSGTASLWQLEATPAPGYVFGGWASRSAGSSAGFEPALDAAGAELSASAVVTLTQNTEFQATFAQLDPFAFTGVAYLGPRHGAAALTESSVAPGLASKYADLSEVSERFRFTSYAALVSSYGPSGEVLYGESSSLVAQYQMNVMLPKNVTMVASLHRGGADGALLAQGVGRQSLEAGGMSSDGTRLGDLLGVDFGFSLPSGLTKVTAVLEYQYLGERHAIEHTYDITKLGTTIRAAQDSDLKQLVVVALGYLNPTLVSLPKRASNMEFFYAAYDKEVRTSGGTLGSWVVSETGGFIDYMNLQVTKSPHTPGWGSYGSLAAGSGKGWAMYWVNGYYADVGIYGWRTYGGEVIQWVNLATNSPRSGFQDFEYFGGGTWAFQKAVALLRQHHSDAEMIAAGVGGMDSLDELVAAFPNDSGLVSSNIVPDVVKPYFDAALDAINAIGKVELDSYPRIQAATAAIAAIPTNDSCSQGAGSGQSAGSELSSSCGSPTYYRWLFQNTPPYSNAYATYLLAQATWARLTGQVKIEPSDAAQQVLATLRANTSKPVFGTLKGDRVVMALARAGAIKRDDPIARTWLASLDKALASGTLTVAQASSATLTLTALGLNATAYQGHDLTSVFSDYRSSSSLSIEDRIVALLALSSKPYGGPPTWAEDYAVSVAQQSRAGGGWGAGESLDPTLTARALTALEPFVDSPYSSATIAPAVRSGLAALKAAQDPATGGFLVGGKLSATATAEVVVALTSVGVDPAGAEWSTASGNNPLWALVSLCQPERGAVFSEQPIGDPDQAATEEAAVALTAWQRFADRRPAIYDMSDAIWSENADVKEVSVNGVNFYVNQETTLLSGDGQHSYTFNVLYIALPYGATLPTKASDFTVVPSDMDAVATTPAKGAFAAPWDYLWVFTVTAPDGETTRTYAIYIQQHDDPKAESQRYLGYAKTFISHQAIAAPQQQAGDTGALAGWLSDWVLSLNTQTGVIYGDVGAVVGVTARATVTDYAPATAGTEASPEGVPGSFTATLTLSRGSGTSYVEDTLDVSGTIMPTRFTVHDADVKSIRLGTIASTRSGDDFTFTMPFTNGATAKLAPDDFVIVLSSDATARRTAAVKGGDGVWRFTVTAPDGVTTRNFTITVIDPPSPVDICNAQLDALKARLTTVAAKIPMGYAGSTSDLTAYMDYMLTAQTRALTPGQYTVSASANAVVAFTAAKAGTATNPAGTPGSFTVTAILGCGSFGVYAIDGSQLGTSSVTATLRIDGVIAPTPYGPSADTTIAFLVVGSSSGGYQALGQPDGNGHFDVTFELDSNHDGHVGSATDEAAPNLSNIIVVPSDRRARWTAPRTDDGVNWRFTLIAQDGVSRTDYTVTMQLPDNPDAAQVFAVHALRNRVENDTYSVSMATANTTDEIGIWLRDRLTSLASGAVGAVPVAGSQSVTPASFGTPGNPGGKAGSFTFGAWISGYGPSKRYLVTSARATSSQTFRSDGTISYGGGNSNTALSGTITPISYQAALGVRSVTVRGVLAQQYGSTFTVVVPYADTMPKAASIAIQPEDPKAKVSDLSTSDLGRTWRFTVTAADGVSHRAYILQVGMAANPAAPNIPSVSALKKALEGRVWSVGMGTANDASAVLRWIDDQIAGMDLDGASTSVALYSTTPAVAGTLADLDGSSGSFDFKVFITKGEGDQQATWVTLLLHGRIVATTFGLNPGSGEGDESGDGSGDGNGDGSGSGGSGSGGSGGSGAPGEPGGGGSNTGGQPSAPADSDGQSPISGGDTSQGDGTSMRTVTLGQGRSSRPTITDAGKPDSGGSDADKGGSGPAITEITAVNPTTWQPPAPDPFLQLLPGIAFLIAILLGAGRRAIVSGALPLGRRRHEGAHGDGQKTSTAYRSPMKGLKERDD